MLQPPLSLQINSKGIAQSLHLYFLIIDCLIRKVSTEKIYYGMMHVTIYQMSELLMYYGSSISFESTCD